MIQPKVLLTETVAIVWNKLSSCALNDESNVKPAVLCKGLRKLYVFAYENPSYRAGLFDSIIFVVAIVLFAGVLGVSIYMALTEKQKPLCNIRNKVAQTYSAIMGILKYINMYKELKARKSMLKFEKEINTLKSVHESMTESFLNDDSFESDEEDNLYAFKENECNFLYSQENEFPIEVLEESPQPPEIPRPISKTTLLPVIVEVKDEVVLPTSKAKYHQPHVKKIKSRTSLAGKISREKSHEKLPILQTLENIFKSETMEKVQPTTPSKIGRKLIANSSISKLRSRPLDTRSEAPLKSGIFDGHRRLLERVKRTESDRLNQIQASKQVSMTQIYSKMK